MGSFFKKNNKIGAKNNIIDNEKIRNFFFSQSTLDKMENKVYSQKELNKKNNIINTPKVVEKPAENDGDLKTNNNAIVNKLNGGYIPVAIFGNDWRINELDFTEFTKSNIITAGVNRIFLKYESDYLFFLDSEIITELKSHDITSNKTTIIATSYTKRKRDKHPYDKNFLKSNFKDLIEIETEDIIAQHKIIFGSIPYLIYILKNYIFKNKKVIFFIFGVSLKWSPESHFWKNEHKTLNNYDSAWYQPRFLKMYRSFEKLKKQNIEMVSCTPDSKINNLIPHIGVDEFFALINKNEN